MQQLPHTAPAYSSMTDEIAVLQLLQTLGDAPRTITIAEMMDLLASMRQRFGEHASLEQVIQQQASQQLRAQLVSRRRQKQEVMS
jgi:hypothetical protein